MSKIQLKHFDKRTLTRNTRLGFVSEEEANRFLKSLPDDAENFETVPFEDEDDEFDDEDDEEDDLEEENAETF